MMMMMMIFLKIYIEFYVSNFFYIKDRKKHRDSKREKTEVKFKKESFQL